MPSHGFIRSLAVVAFALSAAAPASAQRLLEADGRTDTYALINGVLAPGRDAIENPECLHPEFGPHITQRHDAELGKPVFVFHMHRDVDGDTCERIDRQRNEIKTYGPSPAYVKGFLNDTVTFRWRFKLDAGFQPSSSFTHIHQIKAGDGDAGAPIITLTPRAGNPQRMELIHVSSTGASTRVANVPLAPFKGEWIEAYEKLTYSFAGTYTLQVKRLRDGAVLLDYASGNLDLWRNETTFSRPKWGIYRSLNNLAALRDEQVLFDRFCLAKGDDDCAPEAPGFNVSAAPAARVLNAGTSTTFAVTVTAFGGFGGAVELSAAGLPPGASARFEPAALPGGAGTAQLTIATSLETPAGAYAVAVTGTGGDRARSAPVTLEVRDPRVNYPPTVGPIADRLIGVGDTTGPIVFGVDDWETPASALTVTATSSNPAVVADAGLAVGGSGAARTISAASAGASGAAVVTVLVGDGVNVTSQTFVVTVDDAPTLSPPAAVTIGAGGTTGALPFQVADRESAPETLAVAAASSNPALVPASGIVLGGGGAERTVTVTPAPDRTGTATITLTVRDALHERSAAFAVTVDVPPILSPVGAQTIAEDGVARIALSVADAEAGAAALTLTATSSNPELVPAGGLAIVETTSPWAGADVGAVGAPGRSAPGDATLVQASGADIWGTADEGHFVFQPLEGDGEMIARVTGVQNTNLGQGRGDVPSLHGGWQPPRLHAGERGVRRGVPAAPDARRRLQRHDGARRLRPVLGAAGEERQHLQRLLRPGRRGRARRMAGGRRPRHHRDGASAPARPGGDLPCRRHPRHRDVRPRRRPRRAGGQPRAGRHPRARRKRRRHPRAVGERRPQHRLPRLRADGHAGQRSAGPRASRRRHGCGRRQHGGDPARRLRRRRPRGRPLRDGRVLGPRAAPAVRHRAGRRRRRAHPHADAGARRLRRRGRHRQRRRRRERGLPEVHPDGRPGE